MMSAAPHRLVGCLRRLSPVLGEDLGGDHLHGEENPERQQDELIEVAEHGDKVRDQVDRTEGIGDEECRERLGVPRHARVAARQVKRRHVAAELQRPPPPAYEHASPSSGERRPRRHLNRAPRRHESRSRMGVFIAFAALVGSKYSRRNAIFPAEATRNTTYS